MLGSEPEESRKSGGRRTAASTLGMTVAVVAGVAVVGGSAGIVIVANSGGGAPGYAAAVAGRLAPDHALPSGRVAGRGTGRGAASPLRVLSVAPWPGSRHVSGDTTVQVLFSAPLAKDSPRPALRPAVPGQWRASGRTLTFTPRTPFAPGTTVTLRIPAGPAGVRSAAGGLLARPVTEWFGTSSYSLLRLAELLGQLGYLPMSWQPAGDGRITGGPAGGGMAAQEELAYTPPEGSFTWSTGYPATLQAQWRAGQPNPLIRGAVMAFQAQHGLAINGLTSAKFWQALFTAAASGQRNTVGYTYAIARKRSPETLTIWHDGRIVLHSLANTGIPVAPTASGTYPVYERFRFQVMQGTNPDGSHYADPVTFVAYFDGGDAVHYFARGSYGFPQSLGCVELPYTDAERAWPYLTYGSLVTVAG